MTKKLLAVLLAAMMIVTVFAGCTTTTEVWISEEGEDAGNANDGGKEDGGNEDTDGTTAAGRTKKTTAGKTTKAPGKQSRTTRKKADTLKYTPVEDKGANYNVKGTVSIAVDTVRPTDYDAMFDVMMQLYPNVTFEFDYWTHSSNDDGREYLNTRVAAGTTANIMWDEAGEIPTYLTKGYIEPITSYVNKDPEAKNIPANLKADYTYGGELFAVPHQATFELVAFNMDILNKLGEKLPSLSWNFDAYEDYLEKAGSTFMNKNKSDAYVGVEKLFEAYNRVAYYNATLNGGNYGVRGYNYATGQYEVKWLKDGAIQFRKWREIEGAEAWEQAQKKTGAGTLLAQQTGVSNYSSVWESGKSLMEDTGTWTSEGWDTLKFKWRRWTTPNKNGKMMMHIDQCFLVRGSKGLKDNMDACFQILRFMTYSTNGNLARLTMYKPEESSKYNLNSHVFYPTSNSAAVIKAFNDLKCTDEVDEYLVKNIPNSCRYDTFKVVPGLRDADGKWGNAMNDITDGLDPSGAGLDEPAVKVNQELKKYEADLKAKLKEEYGIG